MLVTLINRFTSGAGQSVCDRKKHTTAALLTQSFRFGEPIMKLQMPYKALQEIAAKR
jgi:hypothetical protein